MKGIDSNRKNSNTDYNIKFHVIWITKYKYKILSGPIATRVRDLIWQGCEARGIRILQGSVGKDYIHLLISCPPSVAPSKILDYLKGTSSILLQDEFPQLKKKYWDQHLWARDYFCASVGTVTEEMITGYIAAPLFESFTIED